MNRFQSIAADILFAGPVLDNSARGVYIEALTFSQLRHDGRWRHVGPGWGPWDLQRGTHANNDRVRVQVRAAAYEQYWPKPTKPRYEYGLGWKDGTVDYFEDYYDPSIYGLCEPQSFRCDLFLFAWHGPDLSHPDPQAVLTQSYPRDQTDPNLYTYVICSAADFVQLARPGTKVSVASVLAKPRSTFANLQASLDAACDSFLTVQSAALANA